MSTFNISDKEKAQKIYAKAGRVMLDTPGQRHGAQARNADLVFLRQREPARLQAEAERVGLRPHTVYDVGAFGLGMAEDEICRQPAGGDQQRRQRRGQWCWA